MKTIIAFLLFALSLAMSQSMRISGQAGDGARVYWGTATDSSLKEMWLVDKHYHDSSGTWVRDDNRADSCSRPFWIASEMGTYPVWKYEIEKHIHGVDKDSNTMVYRVETRYVQDWPKRMYWGWRKNGMVRSTPDVTILDTIIVPNTTVTTKVSVGALFFVTGDQARLCPDELPSTANGTTDSIFGDTILVRRQ